MSYVSEDGEHFGYEEEMHARNAFLNQEPEPEVVQCYCGEPVYECDFPCLKCREKNQ